MRAILLTAAALLAAMCPVLAAQAAPPKALFDFDVEFEDCTEYVGIGFVPAGAARALVPASYTPIEVDGSAIMVVRVSACEAVSVAGKPPKPAQVAQVGINVAGLDTTADINNYTLFYVTDSGALLGKLTSAGVPAVMDAQLHYAFTPSTGAFESTVDAPQVPLVSLDGSAVAPGDAAMSFIASWWSEGHRGRVRMRTEFPSIVFSTASVTLTTDVGSSLESLIGATPYSFVLLDSYNAFDTAQMEVQAVP